MSNHRINVILSDEQQKFIEWLAGRDNVSKQTEMQILFELQLREEMELHEDEYLADRG